MLVRAAGRKQRQHASSRLSHLADSLQLPFLCPAQLRWSDRHSRHSPQTRLQSTQAQVTPSPRLHSKLQSAADRQTRSLATVADSYQSPSLPQFPPSPVTDGSLNNWNGFTASSDPDVPFIELHETARQPIDYGRQKMGIGGSPEDLLENLETNLRVGRWERCRRIMHKIFSLDDAAHYALYVHCKFLSARLEAIPADPQGRQAAYNDMRDWFETEVLSEDGRADSLVLVIMIRAALATMQGVKQERAVRRYYELAETQGDDVVAEVINSEDYTDEDLWRLVEIVPEFAAEELDQGQDLDRDHDMSKATTDPQGPAVDVEDAQAQAESPPPFLPGMWADMPNILSTRLKGDGLSSLKDALSRADGALDPSLYNAEDSNLLTPRARQQLIEESASEAAIVRWRNEEQHLKAMGIFSELDPSRPLGTLMWRWYTAMMPLLQEEVDLCQAALDKAEKVSTVADDRLVYAAHLTSIPVTQIATTTILYVMSTIAGGKNKKTDVYTSELKLARVSVQLGKALQDEADAVARKKQARSTKASHRPPRVSAKKQQQWQSQRRKLENVEASLHLDWPLLVQVKIGALLLTKLLDSARISVSRPHPRTGEMVTQEQPAFVHKTLYERGKKQGYLVACPDLLQKLNQDPVGHMIAKRLPMVMEPEPWTGFNKGGYLYYPNPVIRFGTSDKVPRDYARAAIQRGDLNQVFSALDTLGKTPWRINQEVLRVQIEAWNTGEPIANFAPRDPKVVVTEKPADTQNAAAMRKYKDEIQEQQNRVAGYHSQRCFQNFQLEIARAFRHEKLYFPHNVDFRGRAYPIPPYLNHMGADNARGLMKFAEGKELGVEGLRWLKIHLANVFGYDKASLQEREDFTMEHLADIYDSATNPLDGRRWWLKSEDAWQTLAACYELKHALDSPDPTKFVSNLPIHQDGTCNGLQHYAALGGDAVGARQVNLEPGDRPSDVYTAVAESVKAEVEKDFNADHPIAQILHGKITRKVVKQPVMTNVYGVTYYGARAQVKKQLEELLPDLPRGRGAIDHLTMASYVATKIFKSLGEMFTGAQAIQQWLGECADRISTAVMPEQLADLQREDENEIEFMSPLGRAKRREASQKESTSRLNVSKQLFRSSVIWTSPLRLPVVQPYRSTKRKLVTTKLSNLSLQEPSVMDPVSKRKQLQGFPPNFIHSLDATHMMLSATKCQERGMTFASIHDSFWTHACDINDLSRILRDAFVDMHSEDIIGRLRHEFTARYKGAMYLATVSLSSTVGKKILEYQRERTNRNRKNPKLKNHQPWAVQELLLEAKRVRLLASEDPEERKEGEEMITAGSIFAAEKDAEVALALPNDIKDAKLGEIPSEGKPPARLDSVVDLLDDGEVEDVIAEADTDLAEPELQAEGGEEDLSEKAEATKSTKAKKPVNRKVYVWLPLQFPAVPEKGTFDVRRLKKSTYFFH